MLKDSESNRKEIEDAKARGAYLFTNIPDDSNQLKQRRYQKVKQRIRDLRVELVALWFVYRDPRTPWYAKLWSALVAGYAFSPIDLIPDFIPVIGYLDDAIILPIGIVIAIKLIPKDVLSDSREKARKWIENNKSKPKNLVAAVLIVLFWIVVLLALFFILKSILSPTTSKKV